MCLVAQSVRAHGGGGVCVGLTTAQDMGHTGPQPGSPNWVETGFLKLSCRERSGRGLQLEPHESKAFLFI